MGREKVRFVCARREMDSGFELGDDISLEGVVVVFGAGFFCLCACVFGCAACAVSYN